MVLRFFVGFGRSPHFYGLTFSKDCGTTRPHCSRKPRQRPVSAPPMLTLITTCYCTSGIVLTMITKVLHVFVELWKIQKQISAANILPPSFPSCTFM